MFMKRLIFSLFAIIIFSTPVLFAQCNSFSRKVCLPQLQDYVKTGAPNSIVLAPGESADLEVNVFSANDYRFAVCGQEILGKLAFRVLDAKGKVIFDNKEHDMVGVWDFSVKASQKLTIEVTVPEKKKTPTEITESGCATIMIGFKDRSQTK